MANKYTTVTPSGTNNYLTPGEAFNRTNSDFYTAGCSGNLVNTAGVGPSTGSFAVNAQGTPNMTVAVSLGNGIVRATPTGGNAQNFNVRSDASENVTVASNATGSTVYDFLYIKLDADKLNNPNVTGTDAMTYVIQRSTTQYVDSNGALSNGELIAEITVANGASSIANASITDRRRQAAIVGSGGWREINDSSLAYASATTLTTSAGSVFKYPVGTKLRIRQAGSIKYFYVTAVADTLLTITGGVDYTLTNVAIGASAYSLETSPVGFPQWFSYVSGTTPWTAASVNPAIGNGTITARFNIVGRQVNCNVTIVAGTTTTFGTGEYRYTLPVNAVSTTQNYTSGSWMIRQGTAFYPATSTLIEVGNQGTASLSRFIVIYSAGILTSSSQAWASTDIFSLSLSYEI